MSGQTLIFCIGAAKSGTSWLWDYLAGHPEVYLPAVKELHYFDTLGSKREKPYFREQLRERVQAVAERAAREGSNDYRDRLIREGRDWLRRYDGRTPDHAAYLDFLGLDRVGAKVVGDITPAYALLTEDNYREMAGLAGRVKFIFLMRDPVDRRRSNIRMEAGHNADAARLERKIDLVLGPEERNLTLRSDYRRTLNRLLAAVPREDIFIGFYEHLFEPETIERLCDFLGIAPMPAAFERKVHRGRPAKLPERRFAQLTEFLKPQYNFVARLMGDLPAEWTDKVVTA